MTRRDGEPIRVVAYVRIGEDEIDLDALPAEERNEIGARLKVAWLNAMFSGRAVFHADLPEPPPGHRPHRTLSPNDSSV